MCNRGWYSMKGRVAFWFRIRQRGDHMIFCEALFKLFGQQCNFLPMFDYFAYLIIFN